METFEERQERENAQCYKKWLSCGFTGEMKVNKYGWFDSGDCLKGEEKVVFDKGFKCSAKLCYTQLPNGKWISGSSFWCNTHGYAYGLSVWNTQYNTKEEAIEAQLAKIAREIDEKERKKLMKKLDEFRNSLRMPMTQEVFEQVALF